MQRLTRYERQTLTRMQLSGRRRGALDFSVVCALERKGMCRVDGDGAGEVSIEITEAGRIALQNAPSK